MDALHHKPINKAAAIVAGKGEHYDILINSGSVYSILPIKTRPLNNRELNHPLFVDLTGARFGRFTVVGKETKGPKWVCRCDCGAYSTRKQKAVLNKLNSHDRCQKCMNVAALKKKDYFRRTGIDKGVEDY